MTVGDYQVRTDHRRRRTILIAILALALIVRLAVIVSTPHFVPYGDPADYDRYAHTLAVTGRFPPTGYAHPGSPTAFRPPAYPTLLAITYGLTGSRWSAGRVLGAMLGTLTVLLTLLLAEALWGWPTGAWAGGLAAVFLPLVWLNGSLLSESLFLPLELGLVLCLIAYRRLPRLAVALAAGALCGAAALTRTVGLLLIIPTMLALVGHRRAGGEASEATGPRGRGSLVVAPAGAVVVMLLVLVPWTVRNEHEFHTLVPVSTQDGFTLAGEYNPVAGRPDNFQAVWQLPYVVPSLRALFVTPAGADEAQLDRRLRDRALSYALDHPGYVMTAVGLNTLRLIDLGRGHTFVTALFDREMGVPSAMQGQVTLEADFILLLALVGGVTLFGRRRATVPVPTFVWLVPVLMLLAVVPVLGAPRYRAPVDPFLVMVAAVGVVGMGPGIRQISAAARRCGRGDSNVRRPSPTNS